MNHNIRSPDLIQIWSPNFEISISLAHMEHFIVGKKLDCLTGISILKVMIPPSSKFVDCVCAL